MRWTDRQGRAPRPGVGREVESGMNNRSGQRIYSRAESIAGLRLVSIDGGPRNDRGPRGQVQRWRRENGRANFVNPAVGSMEARVHLDPALREEERRNRSGFYGDPAPLAEPDRSHDQERGARLGGRACVGGRAMRSRDRPIGGAGRSGLPAPRAGSRREWVTRRRSDAIPARKRGAAAAAQKEPGESRTGGARSTRPAPRKRYQARLISRP